MLLSLGAVWGQSGLRLVHARHAPRGFVPGDQLGLYGQEGKWRGRLLGYQDSMVWLMQAVPWPASEGGIRYCRTPIPLGAIEAVDRPPRPNWLRFQRAYSGLSMATGSMIILGSSINTLVTEQTPQLGTLAVTALLLTSGLLIRLGQRRPYRMHHGWELRPWEP